LDEVDADADADADVNIVIVNYANYYLYFSVSAITD